MGRPALSLSERDERSVTVSATAERLGCDVSTVYALARAGRLAGHRIGKGDTPKAIRIKVWSIEDWEERHAIGETQAVGDGQAAPPKRRRRSNAADLEADAVLKALGA